MTEVRRGVLSAALLIALLVSPVARGQDSESVVAAVESRIRDGMREKPTSVALEDVYREIVRDWAAGSKTAPAELSALQRLLGLSTGVFCWEKVQRNVIKPLAKHEPESLVPLVSLYHLAYIEQAAPHPLSLFSEKTKEAIFSLIDRYLARSESAASRENASLMLIAVATSLESQAYQHLDLEARDAYVRAVELDTENGAARYAAAFLEEMIGNYRQAAEHLEVLSEGRPEDHEVRLRLALNRARTGKTQAAVDALESIARGDGPDELRIVAYQELASLHTERQSERASAYLREAIERFPRSFRLELQLSYLAHDDWSQAVALVERVEKAWQGDPGSSPRLRYELARQDELLQALDRLAREADRLAPALARGVDRLISEAGARRRRRGNVECRDVRLINVLSR